MINIYETYDPGEAMVLSTLLTARDIPNSVRSARMSGHTGTTSVWILKKADYNKAMELIREFDLSKLDDEIPGGPWKCPECEENVDAVFDECWNCGTSRLSN